MTKYTASFSNGHVATRNSAVTYTHAALYIEEGKDWFDVSFHRSEEAAKAARSNWFVKGYRPNGKEIWATPVEVVPVVSE